MSLYIYKIARTLIHSTLQSSISDWREANQLFSFRFPPTVCSYREHSLLLNIEKKKKKNLKQTFLTFLISDTVLLSVILTLSFLKKKEKLDGYLRLIRERDILAFMRLARVVESDTFYTIEWEDRARRREEQKERGKRREGGRGKQGSKKETSVFENGGKLCVEQRNRKFIQSLITSRQRQHCSGVNNRAVLWVHVAAAGSIRSPDLQRLFAFLISLFSWEFRSPYRRHLAFSLLLHSLPFAPRPRPFSPLPTPLLPGPEIYANTRNDSPRNRFSQTVFTRIRRRRERSVYPRLSHSEFRRYHSVYRK